MCFRSKDCFFVDRVDVGLVILTIDEYNAFERHRKNHPILRNITNQIGNKRSFSSILGNSSVKSVDKGGENVDGKFVLVDDGDNAKRVCVGLCPCNNIRSSNIDNVSGNSNVPNKIRIPICHMLIQLVLSPNVQLEMITRTMMLVGVFLKLVIMGKEFQGKVLKL